MKIERSPRRISITETFQCAWEAEEAPTIPQETPAGYGNAPLRVQVRPASLYVTYTWDQETATWQHTFRLSGHRINRTGKTSIVSMQIDKARIPIVNAGGIGARLWPDWLLELIAENTPQDVVTVTSRILEADPHIAQADEPENLLTIDASSLIRPPGTYYVTDPVAQARVAALGDRPGYSCTVWRDGVQQAPAFGGETREAADQAARAWISTARAVAEAGR